MSVAFITGGSSGLGAGLAPRLAADGFTVAVAARREDALADVVAGIEKGGGKAVAVPLDVADRGAVHAAIDRVEKDVGPIECLVANAGVQGWLPAYKFDVDSLAATMNVNFYGVAHCVERVLPKMLERKSGHIVAVSSLAGFRGTPRFSAYNASKAALTIMLESLRIDCAGTGVDFTVICPGFIHTPMTADSKFPMPFAMSSEAAVRRIHRAIKRKRRLYAFPFPLSTVTRLGFLFPAWLWDAPLTRVFKRPTRSS